MSNNEYDNRNRGAVFVNDKKTNDNQPDRKGTCEIVCPHCKDTSEHWVSGWLKKSRAGATYLSLAFTVKEPAASGSGGSRINNEEDDDIPF